MKKVRKLVAGIVLSFFMIYFIGCDEKQTFIPVEEAISVSAGEVTFVSGGSTVELEISAGSAVGNLTTEVAINGREWCSCELDQNVLKISTTLNMTDIKRTTIVTVMGGNSRADIIVSQQAIEVHKDVKLAVASAGATSSADGHGIENTLDGDYDTYFNSALGEAEFPFYLDYYFSGQEALDYIIYYPRTDGGIIWGTFGEFEVWVASESNTTLTKYLDHNHNYDKNTPALIALPTTVKQPLQVRIVVKSGFNNRVSCGEMEFFMKNPKSFQWDDIFTDGSCSQLKPSVSAEQISAIPDAFFKNIAQQLLDGTYPHEYRIAEYRPYQHPSVIQQENRLSFEYSLKDNPTGIYCSKGDEIKILVGDTKGQNVSLAIHDITGKDVGDFSITTSTYTLRPGLNVITAANEGLMYIYNLTYDDIPLKLNSEADKDKAAAKRVKVHIASGNINGYFDITKHTQDDFLRIIDDAGYTQFDAYGENCHITWDTEQWRTARTDIITLINNYDFIVQSQWDFLGFTKYNRQINNRMHVQVSYGYGAAYATQNRTAYFHSYYRNLFLGEVFESRMWVLSHELGHANQTTGLKWEGTGETTNNIFGLVAQRERNHRPNNLMGNEGSTGRSYYENARSMIIDGGLPHFIANNSDKHFYKLVPFWQIELYIGTALGYTDFYKDLFEYYRIHDPETTSPRQQLAFVKHVCDLARLDMTEFFTKWGFLRECTDASMLVTQSMVDETVAYIASMGYHKPTMDVTLIDDDNYESYYDAVEAGWSVPD